MSEQTYMYEQETAVAALHQVEGFDPRKFMPVSYTHLTLPTNREV